MSKTLSDFNWERQKGSDDIISSHANVENVKGLLDSKGKGFCLAKFKQVTLHLGTGLVHSCHHPSPHKIDLNELENNVMTLFNTTRLKQVRKQMLNGERPKECDYCWRIEDNGNTSDRHFKSVESWAIHDHDKIAQYTGDEDIYPSYLEVDFSNACNLQCTYCGPEFSSKWVEDLKYHGPLKVLEGTKSESWVQGWQDLETLSYKNREHNPYIEAFWEWWPNAYPHLKHYRITGGEPLMSKETFRSMDWFIDNPNPNLEFSINTNLSVPDKLWNKFVEKLKILNDGTKVAKITVYTSVEGWGAAAEYARTGLDFELFKARFEELANIGNVRCVIMSAFNIFSVTTYKQLLEWVYELKCKHNTNIGAIGMERETGYSLASPSLQDRADKNPTLARSYVVGLDIPYLRSPTMLDAHHMSHDLVEKYLIPCLDYMASHAAWDSWSNHQGFERHEVEKLRRIVVHRLYHNRKNDPTDNRFDTLQQRAMFYDFVNENDRRRGTNFLTTFPEMEEFYNICRNAKTEYIQLLGNSKE